MSTLVLVEAVTSLGPLRDGVIDILTIYEDLDGNADIFKDTLFDHSAARVSAAASIAP